MPTSQQIAPLSSYNLTATISSGQAISQEIDLSGNSLCGLFLPAAFTGATIKISASTVSGGTFQTVQKDEVGGGDYTLTVTANKYIPITNLAIMAGLRFIKFTSASNEAADRVVTLAVRPV